MENIVYVEITGSAQKLRRGEPGRFTGIYNDTAEVILPIGVTSGFVVRGTHNKYQTETVNCSGLSL